MVVIRCWLLGEFEWYCGLILNKVVDWILWFLFWLIVDKRLGKMLGCIVFNFDEIGLISWSFWLDLLLNKCVWFLEMNDYVMVFIILCEVSMCFVIWVWFWLFFSCGFVIVFGCVIGIVGRFLKLWMWVIFLIRYVGFLMLGC